MQVVKRNGEKVNVNVDKIYQRIKKMMWGLNTDYVSPFGIAEKVRSGLIDNIETKYIDELIAETAASLVPQHPDYSKLAGRVLVSNLHKETSKSFYLTFKKLYDTGQIRDEVFQFVKDNRKQIETAIDYERDFSFDFFGIRTLQKSYLLKDMIEERFRKKEGKILERPQHLYMRVALEIWLGDIDKVIECYNGLTLNKYIHATPTLFNSSKPYNQLASCFLIDHVEDSIEGINETVADIRRISKFAGGIGLNISNIRGNGSYIRGTGGYSDGIVPYAVALNATARHINQGGGKRKGAFALYLEPWHVDIEDVLKLKLNHGKEERRARDLFYGLWMPDLFMERVQADEVWTLFCPNEAPGLNDVYGDEYKKLYESYEADGRGRKTLKASVLWKQILSTQIETGTPYILYKDAINRKSNFKNHKIIKSSNLCVHGNTKIDILVNEQRKRIKIKKLTLDFIKKNNVCVKSFNTETKEIEYKKILNFALMNESAELVRVTNKSTGTFLTLTPEHKVYTTNRGYIEASNLDTNDSLIETDISVYNDMAVSFMNEGLLVTKVTDKAPVYDITVEDNNNFFANDILIHNCSEILEPSDKDETAVCNLASLNLPSFVKNNEFDFDELIKYTKHVTFNLNRVIDTSKHPTKRSKTADLSQRAIGIGVQGLADIFAILKLNWESEEALKLNKDIFETIYFAALTASNELAKESGMTYKYYENSPISKGIFQFDLWGVTPSKKYDWDTLRNNIKKYGVRNSLLIAPAPTASRAQISGVNECFEPFTYNLYTRRVLSGEFLVSNKYLVNDLIELNMWDEFTQKQLIEHRGSVQRLQYRKYVGGEYQYFDIPQEIKSRYKTSYELSQKIIMNMAADRGAFIDQTQSMNLFVGSPTISKLHSIHFYGWKLGLKTGMYYLRSKPAVNAIQFTVNKTVEKEVKPHVIEKIYGQICSIDDPDCESCGG